MLEQRANKSPLPASCSPIVGLLEGAAPLRTVANTYVQYMYVQYKEEDGRIKEVLSHTYHNNRIHN